MKTIYQCMECKKKYERWPSQVRYGKCLNFCSQKCKGKYQSKNPFRKANTSICVICNKVYKIKKSAVESRGRKCCGWECRKEWMRRQTGEKSNVWKGGIWKTHKGGYIEEMTPQKRGHAIRQLQHRKIMENGLGRKLIYIRAKGKLKEVVHHIDGNKRNNDPSNLEILSASDHARIHALMRGLGTHAR